MLPFAIVAPQANIPIVDARPRIPRNEAENKTVLIKPFVTKETPKKIKEISM